MWDIIVITNKEHVMKIKKIENIQEKLIASLKICNFKCIDFQERAISLLNLKRTFTSEIIKGHFQQMGWSYTKKDVYHKIYRVR